MMKTCKRVLSFLLVLALVVSMAACAQPADPTDPSGTTNPGTTGGTTPTEPGGVDGPEYTLPLEPGYNQVTIYWDYSDDLATADVWSWHGAEAGKGYLLYPCAFGSKTVINVPEGVTELGFITRFDCSDPGGTSWGSATKDIDADRFIPITGKETTVYLKKGDENIYYSNDGGKTLYMQQEITMAGMTSFNTIKYNLNPAVRITSLDQIKVFDGERQIEVTALSSLNNNVIMGTLTLAEDLDLTKVYTIEIEGYGKKNVLPTQVFDHPDFIANYTYDGDDLGAVIDGANTTFKVWAPTASKVVLNLFEKGDGVDAYKTVEMVKGDRGVWSHTEGCGHGTYYTYTVTTAVGTQEATDPYAKSAGVNGNRSMVIDMSLTDPENWASDKVVTLGSYADATIWEVHVRDFSNKISSSKYPGKFMAFTETGLLNSFGASIGVDYLKELGISHIHLLPVYDYATVDETGKGDQFNWGYDPKNYNVPEGSYSTDPYNGEVRVNEFKQMVQALHNQGLGVIMDVVYNHTYDGNSAFNKIVPYYYYRYDSKGANTSASGCGNDTASERYMFRKFMVDSVTHWAKEYNLDGFRFDLMGLHDLETMRQIEEAVHAINPNAIIYGEGWTMGSTIDGSAQANQTNIGKINPSEGAAGSVAVFNDAIRDGLKGSVFEKTGQGYINGDYKANEKKVQFGIQGGGVSGQSWKVPGAAVINYMSAHDNNTLWDKLLLSNPDNTEEERLAMNKLGAAIIIISQGTPFWQAGEEMLRTKGGDENSYKSGDAVNNIDWEALNPESIQYQAMQYYKGLIEMRKAYSIFRQTDSSVITFGGMAGGGMSVFFKDAEGNEAVVLLNPTETAASFTLSGEWKLVANGQQAGSQVIETMSGSVTVEGRGVMVFVK